MDFRTEAGGSGQCAQASFKSLRTMTVKPNRLWCFLVLLLVGLSCAPKVATPTRGNSGQDDEDDISPAQTPIEIVDGRKDRDDGLDNDATSPIRGSEPRKDRIDRVLAHVRKRDLRTDNGFWTIFHGILGLGPDDAMILDPEANKRMKAIDYIASGAPVRGLELIPEADGVEVITMPGSIIGQGHQDQFVAEMAEWDLPRDKKFMVNGTEYTFDDFIRQAR